eukprot:362468-Hanusia_phi.AAC.1
MHTCTTRRHISRRSSSKFRSVAVDTREQGDVAANIDNQQCAHKNVKFFIGTKGKACGKGGVLPEIKEDALKRIRSGSGNVEKKLMSGERFLLEKRQQHMEDIFDSELKLVVNAERIEDSLWRSNRHLTSYERLHLSSVRAELCPLVGPFEDAVSLLEAVEKEAIECDGYVLSYERVNDNRHENISSVSFATALHYRIKGEVDMQNKSLVLVILETSSGYHLCFATYTFAES